MKINLVLTGGTLWLCSEIEGNILRHHRIKCWVLLLSTGVLTNWNFSQHSSEVQDHSVGRFGWWEPFSLFAHGCLSCVIAWCHPREQALPLFIFCGGHLSWGLPARDLRFPVTLSKPNHPQRPHLLLLLIPLTKPFKSSFCLTSNWWGKLPLSILKGQAEPTRPASCPVGRCKFLLGVY